MFWSKQQQEIASPQMSDLPSSLEKGKYNPQRCPSISSTQSSIDSPPKALARLPKATPPPYYSSAATKYSSHNDTASSINEFDRTRDLAVGGHSTSHGGQQRTRRPPGFCRRHWFIITVVLVVITTCGLAVLGVMLQKHNPNTTTYLPSQLTQPAEGDDPETFSYYTFTNVVEQAGTVISRG